MIYEVPPPDAPIRQGDIFASLPRVDLSLRMLPILNDKGDVEQMSWEEVLEDDGPVNAILPIRPVTAIVASQDCDAIRVPDITLCEVRPFLDVERRINENTRPKGYVDTITQHARVNQKWFYLPPCPELGFESRMAADFLVVLRVPRQDLEDLRHLRKCRLNEVAEAHFRERIAEFFRRYPYNEWYPLGPEEMEIYLEKHPDAQRYPWQQPPQPTQ